MFSDGPWLGGSGSEAVENGRGVPLFNCSATTLAHRFRADVLPKSGVWRGQEEAKVEKMLEIAEQDQGEPTRVRFSSALCPCFP
jgi:hypothetical protein